MRPPTKARRRSLALCAAALLAWPALAQEQLESYATRLPIVTGPAEPYYRLSVPLQAYQASAHGDLRDLRIFNAAGQAVPYALLAASGHTEESTQRQSLRWFPLRAPAEARGDNDLNVVVKQAGNGTLVEINSTHAPAHPAKPESLRGYVLDASQVADRKEARSLELDWERSSGSDFQLLDVESSDDLQRWSRIAAGAQLARLDHDGAHIENRSIDLHGLHDRYLRLIWREPAAAPRLTRAELTLSTSRYQSAPLAWSAPIIAASNDSNLKTGEYRFRLARPLPLARLRIELPPGNQLLPLQILAPTHERRHWNPLARGVAYRITSRGREWSNSEIILPGYPLQEFVLRLDPRLSPLTTAPQLAYAVQPAQVIFLASGGAPYTLAIGNATAKDASLSAATLVPGFGSASSPEIADAAIAESSLRSLPAAGAQAGQPAEAAAPDWKKITLWSVLLLGVLGMAAMAWQLLRQMKDPRT